MSSPASASEPSRRDVREAACVEPKGRDRTFSFSRPIVLVRSAGNVGSAIARALYRARYATVLLQDRGLSTLRWRMSFAQAIKDGRCSLQGTMAKVVELENARSLASIRTSFIPFVLTSLEEATETLAPSIIVDACIKGERGHSPLRGLAPLTIGVGPRFTAGVDVDLVIESAWGANLGAVIRRGTAQRQPCAPETISGLAWERFARSPTTGIFRTHLNIGEAVDCNGLVGTVGNARLTAPISGIIRGLLPNGVSVHRGEKFIEIDPRFSNPQCSGIGERSLEIASGVLNAISAESSSTQSSIH